MKQALFVFCMLSVLSISIKPIHPIDASFVAITTFLFVAPTTSAVVNGTKTFHPIGEFIGGSDMPIRKTIGNITGCTLGTFAAWTAYRLATANK